MRDTARSKWTNASSTTTRVLNARRGLSHDAMPDSPSRPRSLASMPYGMSQSLESLAHLRDCVTHKDKGDALLRTLFHVRDNRERLAESLRQYETETSETDERIQQLRCDLSDSWNCQTTRQEQQSGKEVKQQAAIWELCHTELSMLRHLRTIIEVYVQALRHVKKQGRVLSDVDTDRLFPNIHGVFDAHFRLWRCYLRPALLSARNSDGQVRIGDFSDGFAEFGEIFAPSAKFCLRIADSKDYLKVLEKNDLFNEFVKWAQRRSARRYSSSPDGTQLDTQLKSLLTMPFQRLMRYGLLLQEILRHTDKERDRSKLETMIASVNEFCSNLNNAYQQKSDEEEVRAVADRLEVDGKRQEVIDSFGEEFAAFAESLRFDLCSPMPHSGAGRRKLGEAELRMRDEKGKWCDIRCLLFTDLLLLARPVKRSLRLLRPPVRLDKLALRRLAENCSFLLAILTDFGSVDSVLCLAAGEQRQCNEWQQRIGDAIDCFKAELKVGEASSTRPEETEEPAKQKDEEERNSDKRVTSEKQEDTRHQQTPIEFTRARSHTTNELLTVQQQHQHWQQRQVSCAGIVQQQHRLHATSSASELLTDSVASDSRRPLRRSEDTSASAGWLIDADLAPERRRLLMDLPSSAEARVSRV